MPSITATSVILAALGDLNVLQKGETLSSFSDGGTDEFTRLNFLVGQLAQQGLIAPAIGKLIFPLVAGKGGAANPYTIGVGGDLNTPRPPYQDNVVGAGLILGRTTLPVAQQVTIPRPLITDDGFETMRLQDLTSTLFTTVYYRPDYAGDLGSIILWPVPTDLTNALVLYVQGMLSTFADLTTSYSVPPGYEALFHWNLAENLLIPYGRVGTPIDARITAQAIKAMALVKRSNIHLSDLPNDLLGIGGHGRSHGYNILTGEGG